MMVIHLPEHSLQTFSTHLLKSTVNNYYLVIFLSAATIKQIIIIFLSFYETPIFYFKHEEEKNNYDRDTQVNNMKKMFYFPFIHGVLRYLNIN